MLTILIFAFSLGAKRLGRWNLTAPIVFVAAGWLLSLIVDATPGQVEPFKVLAEATLAIVLFTDAAGVRPRQIGKDGGFIFRLLLLGLPLTIILGLLVAVGLFPAMSVLFALLLASMLAPTDAALGAATVMNKAVPLRVRRVLNVESGLNDGLATPVVLFAIAAIAGEEGLTARTTISSALLEIGLGALIGAAVGVIGGRALRWSRSHEFSTAAGRTVATLMLPALAYSLAVVLHGNGFISAFVAGSFFAAALRSGEQEALVLAEEVMEPMGYATWLAFGALAVPLLIDHVSVQEFVYAIAALTVIRMVPVALCLLGTGLRLRTVAFIGWFGPRGLASVVFTLIALETLEPTAELATVLEISTITILLSVLAHGMSATPWARRYGAWVAQRPKVELGESVEPRSRGALAVATGQTGATATLPTRAGAEEDPTA